MNSYVSDLVEAIADECRDASGIVDTEKVVGLLSDVGHDLSILCQKIEAFQVVGEAIEESDGAMDIVIIPHDCCEAESEDQPSIKRFSDFIKDFGCSLTDELGNDVSDHDLNHLIDTYIEANSQ